MDPSTTSSGTSDGNFVALSTETENAQPAAIVKTEESAASNGSGSDGNETITSNVNLNDNDGEGNDSNSTTKSNIIPEEGENNIRDKEINDDDGGDDDDDSSDIIIATPLARSISTSSSPSHHSSSAAAADAEDLASRTASALAAVAAAATANASSPSQAAEAARALVPGVVPAETMAALSSMRKKEPQRVKLSAVKAQLLLSRKQRNSRTTKDENNIVDDVIGGVGQEKDESPLLPSNRLLLNVDVIADKLAEGGNDAFLQHLLLCAHYRLRPEDDNIHADLDDDNHAADGDSNKAPQNTSASGIKDEDEFHSQDADDDHSSDSEENETSSLPASSPDPLSSLTSNDTTEQIVSRACDDVKMILSKAKVAFHAMMALLPQPPVPVSEADSPSSSITSSSLDINNCTKGEGQESDISNLIIPDLLPPCSTESGDASTKFFQACLGQVAVPKNLSSTEKDKHSGVTGMNGSSNDTVSENATGDNDASQEAQSKSPPAPPPARTVSPTTTASSVFSSVMSSVNRRQQGGMSQSTTNVTAAGAGSRRSASFLFGKRRRQQGTSGTTKPELAHSESLPTVGSDSDIGEADDSVSAEYTVQIDREMLGLTVENVLERTVVRTVLPGGAAKKAGAKVGSLIVKVGNVDTKNLTHFETIDELRRSQRPLRLILRRMTAEDLHEAREEMGRLIRGGGFGAGIGTLSPQEDEAAAATASKTSATNETAIKAACGNTSEEAATKMKNLLSQLHLRWSNNGKDQMSEKEKMLIRVGEKLVWILTLLVLGLEIEALKLSASAESEKDMNDDLVPTERHRRALSHHTSKDYTDAAKSVAKVLFDYCTKHLEKEEKKTQESPAPVSHMSGMARQRQMALKKKQQLGLPPPPPPPGGPPGKQQRGVAMANPQALNAKMLLLQIGDVLHRTRSFLADPISPPASLLRGEIISFLCDVLDVDTEMDLSEEESALSIAGHKAGPINDLGSAGSLLKLIVLNCSMMKSVGCISLEEKSPPETNAENSNENTNKEPTDTHKLHAGNRFLAVVHRLAASRSTSARVTACSLSPVLWAHLDFPHQLQLRGVITRALHDVEVIVRKSTATVLHEIAELVFDPRAVPWLVLMCERAMTDPEPQLRAAAMTLTWHLAEHLPNAFLGDASKGSRSLRRLPPRTDPTFAEVYLLQCKLLPVATRLADDRAPSVRLAVAAQCDRLCSALGEHWASVIIDLLQALLGDSDDRVRSEATLCIPRLVEIVLLGSSSATHSGSVSVLEALLPLAIKLLKDPSAGVRVSLATSSGELLTLLVGLKSLDQINTFNSGESEFIRHNKHVDETLIPLVQRLLHDPDPEVTSAALRAVSNASRGNVREIQPRHPMKVDSSGEDDTVSLSSHQSHASREKREPVFIPVLSEEQVLRLLPTLSDLANSSKWRVRQSAVEIVPALLGCTHQLHTRSEIAQLCVRLMDDTVDAVRKTAAECLCLGGGGLGSHGEDASGEWITHIVLPHLNACKESTNSKQRMLCLKMVEVILLNGVCPSGKKGVPPQEVDGEELPSSPLRALLEVAASLSFDRTVNVRLNVGRVLGNVVNVLEDEELKFLVQTLDAQLTVEQAREGGGDRDVVFFAKRALHMANGRIEDDMLLPSLQDCTTKRLVLI